MPEVHHKIVFLLADHSTPLGPQTATTRLPNELWLNFGTFRVQALLDIKEYLILLDLVSMSDM